MSGLITRFTIASRVVMRAKHHDSERFQEKCLSADLVEYIHIHLVSMTVNIMQIAEKVGTGRVGRWCSVTFTARVSNLF